MCTSYYVYPARISKKPGEETSTTNQHRAMSLTVKFNRGLPKNFKAKLEEEKRMAVILAEKTEKMGTDLASYAVFHDEMIPILSLIRSTYQHFDTNLDLGMPGIRIDESIISVENDIVSARATASGLFALLQVLGSEVLTSRATIRAYRAADEAVRTTKGELNDNIQAPLNMAQLIAHLEDDDDEDLTGGPSSELALERAKRREENEGRRGQPEGSGRPAMG